MTINEVKVAYQNESANLISLFGTMGGLEGIYQSL